MNPTFDIDALRAVVAGIELRSFAQAATQLGRSQSAISMQLKKLEQQAGTQLFVRKGRGLVATEAGEELARYARQIIALNDEAARAMGASTASKPIRLGLPQDFFDTVLPATLATFTYDHPDTYVGIRAGLNHTLVEEVRVGRLDCAIILFPEDGSDIGTHLCRLPMRWFAAAEKYGELNVDPLPLVLFDHPCIFRQAALSSLQRARRRLRIAVTTPSLPAVWGGVRSGLGVAVRTDHGKPDDIRAVCDELDLPKLPNIDLRMVRAKGISPAAQQLSDLLEHETVHRVCPA